MSSLLTRGAAIISEKDYILYGDIEDFLKSRNNQMHKNTTFIDAYFSLSQNIRTHKGTLHYPDFMQWDFNDDTTISALIRQIPVLESNILPPIHKSGSSLLYLPTIRKIFISKEMAYQEYGFHIDDCYTLLYVLQGHCHLGLENREFTMEAGELCIISPLMQRKHYVDEKDIVFSVMIDKDIFEQSFLQLIKGNNFLSAFFRKTLFQSEKDFLFFMLPPNHEIRQIYQHLFKEFTHPDAYSDDMCSNYLNILFTMIIRSNEATYNYYSDGKTAPAQAAIPFILQYMEEHFTDISLEALASQFHYEKGYLSKLIHKYTGKTYTEIICHYKLEKASELLRYSNEKINVIAERTGYNSNDHFTRSFRQYTGMSPSQYRKRITLLSVIK